LFGFLIGVNSSNSWPISEHSLAAAVTGIAGTGGTQDDDGWQMKRDGYQ
jgi:hypothetical protein